jgi:tRNA 5-methylaminomethyl-2-thiouridine biosynthesis bifunctional protein
VLGAGIAAAAVTRALLAQGCSVLVVAGSDAGASGNPVALVTPRLERTDSVAARFSAQAFRRATALYEGEAEEAIVARGVRRLGNCETLARLACTTLFEDGALTLDPDVRRSPKPAAIS